MTEFSVVKPTLTPDASKFPHDVTDIPSRRRHNLKLALDLAAAGIYVFPVVDKNPVIEGWTKPDTEVEQVDGEFRGCTRDPARIKKMWRRWPDATPSVSCGPSGVIVLDADTKKDGPAKLTQWLADNDIDISQYPVTHTRSGGLHIYLPNDHALGCSAGMFKDLGTDVKGVGGQVVAPGAIRDDGKAYTADADHPALTDFDPSLSEAPPKIVEAIKTAPKNQIGTDKTLESELIETLRGEDWPDGEDITDVSTGKYDLDILCAKDERLKVLLETGGNMSHSEARWHLASSLWAEYGDKFNVLDFAGIVDWLNNREGTPTDGAFGVFVGDDKPGEGEFSYRSLARDFYRSENEWRVTDGSAFTAVEAENDNYDDGALPPEQQALKEKRKPFEIIRGDALANSWTPQQWTLQGLIPTRGVGMLIGDANVGKSFLALGLADAITRGEDWFGLRTRRGHAIYIPGEGVSGVDGRLLALKIHTEKELTLGVLRGKIDLFESGRETTAKIIKSIEHDMAACPTGTALRVVILDTLAACAPGMDENSAGDINVVLAHAREIERRFSCVVLVLHHMAKNSTKYRGSSALRGNIDFMLQIDDPTKGPKDGRAGTIRADKQRDGRKIGGVGFALKEIELGELVYDDGEVEKQTSCVAVQWPAKSDGVALGNVECEDANDAPTLKDANGVDQIAGESSAPPPAEPPESIRDTMAAAVKQRRAQEREAKAHAKTPEGRWPWYLRALEEFGDAPFAKGDLRTRANFLRATPGFAEIRYSDFDNDWRKLCAQNLVRYVGRKTTGAIYQRTSSPGREAA